jgi:hypothetical protein
MKVIRRAVDDDDEGGEQRSGWVIEEENVNITKKELNENVGMMRYTVEFVKDRGR